MRWSCWSPCPTRGRAVSFSCTAVSLPSRGFWYTRSRLQAADPTKALSGEVRTLRSWGEVISEEDGRAARMIGICQDVTEQVAASEGLERSLSLLQATLESTADGLLLTGGGDFTSVPALFCHDRTGQIACSCVVTAA